MGDLSETGRWLNGRLNRTARRTISTREDMSQLVAEIKRRGIATLAAEQSQV